MLRTTRFDIIYEKGVQKFRRREGTWGRGHFDGIYRTLTYEGRGEFLYEQLEDGHWAYRCDELTRSYALSAFYYGLVYADYRKQSPRHEQDAKNAFCAALKARPDVILEAVQHEVLSPVARTAFEAAKRDPICNPEGGWRTEAAGPHRPFNLDFKP